MNLFGNMEEIANMIIRPSRYYYKINDLGPKTICENGILIYRTDFEIKNKRNLEIKCSLFSKKSLEQCESILIYLHCNSGCRIEGMAYLKQALEHDFSYFVFDFTGSGISEGKYVSLGMLKLIQALGFHESEDLECVLKHLRCKTTANIMLWGRSMGAVTALRYLSKNCTDVLLAIFDSPFQSLKELFLSIGKQKTSFPEIILQLAYKYLKPIIKEKAHFDVDDVEINCLLNKIKTKGIFIASKKDDLVPYSQIDGIFEQYKGEKEMLFIDELHNEPRNKEVIHNVFETMKKYICLVSQRKREISKDLFVTIVSPCEGNKKKLELTIKSQSKRNLISKDTIGELQATFNEILTLEKKPQSCVFAKYKTKGIEVNVEKENIDSFVYNEPTIDTRVKREVSIFHRLENQVNCKSLAFFGNKQNRSEYLLNRKKPEDINDFSADNNNKKINASSNINEIKIKPKFFGDVKMISLKLNKNLGKKNRERKTLQNISRKRPPLVELKVPRNSFDINQYI